MKLGAVLLVVIVLAGLLAPVQVRAAERSKPLQFFVGCCLGVRTVSAWNEGKELHWRDWGRFIPGFSLYIGIIDGIDGSNGITTADLTEKYGSVYY